MDLVARARSDQTNQTRQRLLRAAEALFAEHGIAAVSNRQISEAAGQGNNFAVGYHFGSKTDLVRTLLTEHQRAVDEIRSRMVGGLGYIAEFRQWVDCLVRPQFEYINTLGKDSHFARFCSHASVEPTTLTMLYEYAGTSQAMITTLEGMYRTLPALPAAAIDIRNTMTRHALAHSLADYENFASASEEGTANWSAFSDGVTDALVGLWLAPAT